MTEREKMIAGFVYDPSDDELIQLRQNAHRLSKEYNDCFETDEKREKILAELIPNKGKNYIFRDRFSSITAALPR